ncbi:hypothetical protein SLEP1_g39425 [Rubroshorea leprosula]|uniref:Uncharacterized protein n=1 Tax=Rubroshorea leprosula TaxID=152421 RepID=A0AAV5L0F7_9ROSI|nr:hypothetical protein SLEP1_g39425 [Rubroshorea leprosula]
MGLADGLCRKLVGVAAVVVLSERKRGKFCELAIFLSRPVLPIPVHEFEKLCLRNYVLDCLVILALGLSLLSCAIKVSKFMVMPV